MPKERWDVFLSYGHEDAAWVGALAGNLHRDGFDVFLDQWELVGGDRVAGRLEEGIRGSTSGILVVSPHALSRAWVREEYEALLHRSLEDPLHRLVPVLYRDTDLPPFLANRSWVDFRGSTTGPSYDAALEELERALSGIPTSSRPARGSTRVWPAGPRGQVVRPAGPIQVSLVIAAGRVVLREGATEVVTSTTGLKAATVDAVKRLHGLWRASSATLDGADPEYLDSVLADVGRGLSADFLQGAVRRALAKRVFDAVSLNEVLEIGICAPGLTDLPWEALLVPSADEMLGNSDGTPLALHRNVCVYREVDGARAVAAHKVRGPLRILVAIASPESQNGTGELLNYEAELARIVSAVDPIRRGGAQVRVLPEGSLHAIRSALEAEPEGFHVLHVSCHARPGVLVLETQDGDEDPVTAQRLLDEALPAGADVPMVVLSCCATRLIEPDNRGRSSADKAGQPALDGVAERLLRSGLPVVLAMQAPVSDIYATELTGELYRYLSTAETPDPLYALSSARRSLERARKDMSPDALRRERAEWATPTLWVRGLRLPLFNTHEPFAEVAPAPTPSLAAGVVARRVGEFVGRRRELRTARRTLAGPDSGIVIHAIGGVGKSTLAAEIVASRSAHGPVASLHGSLSIDAVLYEVAASVSSVASAYTRPSDLVLEAAAQLRRADLDWTERWRVLADGILAEVQLVVFLDNFEVNLHDTGRATFTVRDPELADLLARWARQPGLSRLLFTSRHPFALPDGAERRLLGLHLGPLSPAETAKLFWQLPGLEALSPQDRQRAYRDVGGHPRTLEYLDALLQGGHARFDDVAERLERRLTERGIRDPAEWIASQDRGLNQGLAQVITMAVDDILLQQLLDAVSLTPRALELVVGASVYRVPVDDAALVQQLADEIELGSDPDRVARSIRWEKAFDAEQRRGTPPSEISVRDLDLDAADIAAYEADLIALQQPVIAAERQMLDARAAAATAGLIAPVVDDEGTVRSFVHRWTARAIEALDPERTIEAHRRAANYWQSRLALGTLSPEDVFESLIEARYHLHASGEHRAALELSDDLIAQLQTWGQYGRATELCRETLSWADTESKAAAIFTHRLGILMQLRGDYDHAERQYLVAMAIGEALGDRGLIMAGEAQLGTLAQLRGDYDRAERQYTKAMELANAIKDHGGRAHSHHQLGTLAELRGDYGHAENHYMQALALGSQRGDIETVARVHHQLGSLEHRRGHYANAEKWYLQSLEIKQGMGDQLGVATTYHQLGLLAEGRGDYDLAEDRYRCALEINESLGNPLGIAIAHHQLGTLAAERGDYDSADRFYRQSLDSFQRLRDEAGIARAYHQLGTLAQRRGQYDEAEQRYLTALAIKERLGDDAGIAAAHQQLGHLAYDRGDYESAESRYSLSMATKQRLGDKAGIAVVYHQRGMLKQAQGEYADAEVLYRRSLELEQDLGNQAGAADTHYQLGVLAELRGRDDDAESNYRIALDISGRIGAESTMAQTLHQLGSIAQRRRSYDEAEELLMAALAIDDRLDSDAGHVQRYAALGLLMADRGNLPDAVGYELLALATTLKMKSPLMYPILRRLFARRGKLGAAPFAATAKELFGDAGLARITELIDRYGDQSDEPHGNHP